MVALKRLFIKPLATTARLISSSHPYAAKATGFEEERLVSACRSQDSQRTTAAALRG